MRRPAASKSSHRRAWVASNVPFPGRAKPSASLRQFMLLAVNMPEQEPHVGHADLSSSASSASLTPASLAAIIESMRSSFRTVGWATGWMPRYGHRSDPHTHVAEFLTIASVGLMIVGVSRTSKRKSRGP